jgi:hypothetical protein
MPLNYQNGKIYKIYSYENDEVYYGSTVETLSRRMSGHRKSFKQYKNGKCNFTRSFQILEYESAKIELVENFCCNSKEELLQREGYYIRNNNCINKNIAGRTQQIWREENKEHIKEQNKEYKKENKEHIKEQNKEYCEKNKEYIKEQKKEYRQQNKEHIKEQKKEYRQRKKEQALMLKEDINII